MLLHTFHDRFCLSSEHFPEALSLDRRSDHIARIPAHHLHSTPASYNQQIDGLIGIISLVKDRYLIVITESKQAASIAGAEVRQLIDAEIIPFNNDAHSSLQPDSDEDRYLQLVRRQLRCGSFYFSYDYDLTLSTQAISQLRSGTAGGRSSVLTPWKRADPRFFWNRYLSKPLIEQGADEWVLPLMNGYVFSQSLTITTNPSSSHAIDFILISRRSVERSGRRFTTRGLDMRGHAANFAETEQIIFVHENNNKDGGNGGSVRVCSFLQTRGSIPLLWQQPPTMKYTPKIQILKEGKDTETAFRRHFETQIALYGKQFCVNLVNQKGSEGLLAKGYSTMVKMVNNKKINLTNFDFHHECRKMKYENIYKLFHIIGKDEIEKNINYFHARLSRKGEWEILSTQEGVFRTNCIDCLDRTNVVQSVFARFMLEKQLRELGIWKKEGGTSGAPRFGAVNYADETITFPHSLEAIFKHVWANNADAMSFQYSGTGALKTDYTRTGKRTIMGALQDGVNSVTRYYLNNFQDGTNQDATDLFLGYHQPTANTPSYQSPFDDEANSHSRQSSLIAFLIRFIAVFTLFWVIFHKAAPSALTPLSHYSFEFQVLVYFVFLLALGSRAVLRYGRSFTNKPRLRVHHLISS